jgi:uncharacterized protein (TIGR00661 family)
MRILFGVVGEGMGHAMRSRVVIDHLARHHAMHVVVSGRAHDYLEARRSDRLQVKRIWGLSIVYEDNEVRNFRTAFRNLKGAVTGGWPKNVRAYFDLVREFRPEVVVSDFESWSHLYGKAHRLPVVSLDNIQVVARCTHAPEIVRGHELDFQLAKAVVKAKLPGCLHYLITTFFFPPVRKPRTSLHPPVLRPEVLAARSEPGDHLLVYQTSESNEALPAVLASSGRECRIYGFRRDLTGEVVEGRLRYQPLRAAVHRGPADRPRGRRERRVHAAQRSGLLHKPVLASPVRKQFEQCSTLGTSRPRVTASPPSTSTRRGSGRSWSECPSSRRSSPAGTRTATSSSSQRSTSSSPGHRRAANRSTTTSHSGPA